MHVVAVTSICRRACRPITTRSNIFDPRTQFLSVIDAKTYVLNSRLRARTILAIRKAVEQAPRGFAPEL